MTAHLPNLWALREQYERDLEQYEAEMRLYREEREKWREVWERAGEKPPLVEQIEPKRPELPRELVCEWCDGEGVRTCPDCNGTGKSL